MTNKTRPVCTAAITKQITFNKLDNHKTVQRCRENKRLFVSVKSNSH
ncbi:hypothetical protein SALWKB2_1621 [Snodgrassella alvi wkB2]|nr:hypothetical protein SALWKB2_1621 [Snodgrassella alvi wkB2]